MKLLNRLFGAMAVAAVLAVAAMPALAANYPDFTIDENSVSGTSPSGNSALVADRLNGLYTETFAPTYDAGSSTTGTFTSTAVFNISGYYNNDILVSGVLGCSLSACYNLYATFTSTGTFSIDSNGVITFTGVTASVSLYLDPDQSVGGDTLLGSTSTLIEGSGSINPALNNGDFEIVFGQLTLTADGESFFVDPDPFYLVVDVNGNFTENPLTSQVVSGSANAFFVAVPEPGSLALVGAALVGLGALRRRKA